jgi:hypothetical protein
MSIIKFTYNTKSKLKWFAVLMIKRIKKADSWGESAFAKGNNHYKILSEAT